MLQVLQVTDYWNATNMSAQKNKLLHMVKIYFKIIFYLIINLFNARIVQIWSKRRIMANI